jgi:hypothetical protein
VLLGRTADAGRVWDVIAAVAYTKQTYRVPVRIAASGSSAAIAAFALLLGDEDVEAELHDLPSSLESPGAPVFLNVLRVCDLAEVIAMLNSQRVKMRCVPKVLTTRLSAIRSSAGRN